MRPSIPTAVTNSYTGEICVVCQNYQCSGSVKNAIISSTVGTHIVCLSNGFFFPSTFCCGTVHTCWTSTPLYPSCNTAGLKWDMWFSQWCCWGFRPSGIWRRVCGSLAVAVPSKRREPFAQRHVISQTSNLQIHTPVFLAVLWGSVRWEL